MPGGLGPTVKLSANLLRLMRLKGARVSLSLGQTKFRQYVKYLTALDFHLACEIVDSYLTHPPLFGICYPKPLVAHSYLVALAASASIIARIAEKGEAHLTRHPLRPLRIPRPPWEHCQQPVRLLFRSVPRLPSPRALHSQQTTLRVHLLPLRPARSQPLQARLA